MKRVFSKTSMVAHVWAQQSQSEGRASNMYFRDRTIYSYGSHFPMAEFVTNKRGERAVLFTTRTYSVTTAKHLREVRDALRGLDLPIFTMRDVQCGNDPPNAEAKAEYQARIEDVSKQGKASRTKARQFLEQAQRLTAEANAYSEFFKFRWRLKPPVIDPEKLAKADAALAKANATYERLRLTKHERALARVAKLTQLRIDTQRKWLAGEDVQWLGESYTDPTQLRVFGDRVQTTRGAEVPVEHAKRVWPLILRCKEQGTAWRKNGHREPVGHFEIDEIREDGSIKAGCHDIGFDQINKIALQLGLTGGVHGN